MKTALKTASTATIRTLKSISTTLRRWFAWHKMRSVEIALNDTYTSLDHVADIDTYCLLQANIRILSKELCRLRAEYQALLKPGKRIVWEVA